MPTRSALPSDLRALSAFLERHVETSMFLLGNLDAHGLGESAHPHAMQVWHAEDTQGPTGVLGLTRGGILLMQQPGGGDWRQWRRCLAGARVSGLNGAADQVAALADALGLAKARFALWSEQPLMTLHLSDLAGPFADIRAPGQADLPLLTGWFAAYGTETGTADPRTAPDRAQAALARGDLRLLIEQGAPVAMSAINARFGSVVQVGGVFTPPEGRGCGRAGRLVAAQLAELRTGGIRRAILFAATPTAEATYRRIGFAVMGRYGVAVLDPPVEIAP